MVADPDGESVVPSLWMRFPVDWDTRATRGTPLFELK